MSGQDNGSDFASGKQSLDLGGLRDRSLFALAAAVVLVLLIWPPTFDAARVGATGDALDSPLEALLLALPVPLASAIGALALGLTALAGARVGRQAGFPWAGTVFAVLVLLGFGHTTAVLGTGTTIVSALALATLSVALDGRERTTGVLLGLLCLARIDGLALAVPLVVVLWLRRRTFPWRIATTAAAFVAPRLVWALATRGTVLAPPGSEELSESLLALATRLVDGFPPAWLLARVEIPAIFPALALVLLVGYLVSRSGRIIRREPVLAVPLAFPVLQWLWLGARSETADRAWLLLPGWLVLVLFCLLTWADALAERSRAGAQSPVFAATSRLARIRDIGLLTLAVVACGLYFHALHDYAFEDAYITFRYADNIAAGHGFVFQPGERVLGTSTPFFALLLAGVGLLGLDIPLTALFLNALGLTLIALGGAWIARRHGLANVGTVFAVAVLWNIGGLTHFFGMETTTYVVLMLGALVAALTDRPATSGVLLGLACLTRYDGILLAVTVLAIFLWRQRRIPWRAGLAFSAVMGPWLVFAQVYFGSMMPNTLGAKGQSEPILKYMYVSLAKLSDRLFVPIQGILGSRHDQRLLEAVLLLLLVAPLLAWSVRLLRRECLLAALLIYPILLWLGYSVISPPTQFQWYLIPGMYLFVLFCLLTWGTALWASLGGRRLEPWATILSLTLIAGSFLALPLRTEDESHAVDSYRYRRRAGAYERLAGFIHRNQLQDLEILTREPGYLTYQSRNPVIDAAGLVTKDILFHGPLSERTSLKKVIDTRQPAMMVFGEDDAFLANFPEYLPIYYGTIRALYMRDNVFRERLPSLARDWLEGSSFYPTEVTDSHPLDWNFERSDFDGAKFTFRGWWGAPDFVTSVKGVTYHGEPVDDEVVSTQASVIGRSTVVLSSPPFRIDFDELSFRFVADGGKATYAELLVNGLPVLTADGVGRENGVMDDVRWTVASWRGKVGVLRFVDRSEDGNLAADRVTSSRYTRSEVFADFEDANHDRWEWTFQTHPVGYEVIADRLGLRFILGRGSALSLLSDTWQTMKSRPFVIDHDQIALLVHDFGGDRTQVELHVGDTVVRRFTGRYSNRLESVIWPVREFRGQEAVLVVFDRDNRPGRGIGLDDVVFFDP